MYDILGDGGILKEVVQPGEGPPVPQNASVISSYNAKKQSKTFIWDSCSISQLVFSMLYPLPVYYSGYLEYSNQPFESTSHLQYPPMMKLGRDVTLAGLELGLLTMKKGEFSRFLLQPQYAYGEMGCPPFIPAAAAILYEVHVLDYLDSGQVDEFIAMSSEEQSSVPLSTLVEVINTLRSFGNRFFNQSRYDHAKDRYKQAIILLRNWDSQNEPDKEKIQVALLPLYMNLSLAELRLENPQKALKYGKKALEIDSANTKALFRCGQAYHELQEFESAQDCLIAAQSKKPFDSDINNLLKKVALAYKDGLDKEKDMYSKMFRELRSSEQ
ncbi:inactive peptidyl-prolyl cis-trans isomerase FKBP6 isoform X1 [Xiphophorus hellerii]|uniref:inactive peptidyl-prolyl cis-trans isomerase FKBP6 isoform X1 n=1 Tax=Xiphophorus hellerii TaxID=8084 RepID=UPI0013B37678|nr:inactive peptidyl-prolyl cis-trans isomerase FKBP6 isoform X1 [Xiphophorus hellerii]